MVTPEGAERWTAMELQMELSEGGAGRPPRRHGSMDSLMAGAPLALTS